MTDLAALVGLELLDVLPGAVMVATGGCIVFANRASFELFGVADLPTLAAREASRAHVLGADVERVDARLTAISRGEPVAASAQYRLLRPDGTTRVVEWTTIPIVLANGPALLYAGDDVTELVLTRDALAVSEKRQRLVIATLAEGVIVVDSFGVCTDANPSAAHLLGLKTADQLVGVHADLMPMVDIVGDPLTRTQHPVWRALDFGEEIRNETFCIRFRDRTRRMRVSTLRITDVDGQHAGAVVTFDDVTAQLEEQERTAASEARFRKLAAVAPVGVFETDAEGMCTYVNGRWQELTGRDEERTLGSSWTAALRPDDQLRVTADWARAASASQRFKTEFHFLDPNGAETFVCCEAAPVMGGAGEVLGWIGTATDLSAELALRHELRSSEERFRSLVEQSPDVVVRVKLAPWRIDYISPTIVDVTGCTREEFYADPSLLAGFIHPDDLSRVVGLFNATAPSDQLEYRLTHRDGSTHIVELRSNVIFADGVPAVVEATLRDITKRKAEHDTLERLAHHDELTGILNRRAVIAALDVRLASREPTAVIYLDLDGFKGINDTHGHDAGDEVLRTIARRLVDAVRDGDIVGRIGGDEFVVISLPGRAGLIAQRLTDRTALPIALSEGAVVTLGASVGITNFDPNGLHQQSDDLLRRADQAMYHAKRQRRASGPSSQA